MERAQGVHQQGRARRRPRPDTMGRGRTTVLALDPGGGALYLRCSPPRSAPRAWPPALRRAAGHGDPRPRRDRLPRLSQYRCYRSQLTGLEVPLRNITTSEAAILRDALGGGSDPRVQIERQRLLDSTAADGLGNAELQERQRRLLIANQQEASRSAFGMNGTWGELQGGSFSLSSSSQGWHRTAAAVRAGARARRRRFARAAVYPRRRRRRRPRRRRARRARASGREKGARWRDGGEGARWLHGDAGVGWNLRRRRRRRRVGVAVRRADGGRERARGGGEERRRRRPASPTSTASASATSRAAGRTARRMLDGELVMGANGRPERAAGAAAGEHRRHERQRAVARARALRAARGRAALLRATARRRRRGRRLRRRRHATSRLCDARRRGDGELDVHADAAQVRARVPAGPRPEVARARAARRRRGGRTSCTSSSSPRVAPPRAAVQPVWDGQARDKAVLGGRCGAAAAGDARERRVRRRGRRAIERARLAQTAREGARAGGRDRRRRARREGARRHRRAPRVRDRPGDRVVAANVPRLRRARRDARRRRLLSRAGQAQSPQARVHARRRPAVQSGAHERADRPPGADGRAADGAGANGDGDGGGATAAVVGNNRQFARDPRRPSTDPEAALRAAQGAIDEAPPRAAMGSEGSTR